MHSFCNEYAVKYKGKCHSHFINLNVRFSSKLLDTVYWEIFAVKKFSRLSVTAKISRTKFFLQRNTVTVFLIQEVRCRP